MQIAQRLFQGVEIGNGEMEGLITYHRTDSTTLSEKALNESARVIRDMFGAEYYDGPRRYQTKVKNAQEAHEAIRPTDFRLAPQQLAAILDADDLRLYELIWKRTMASQMVDARVQKTTRRVHGADGRRRPAMFTASGKTIEFAGFRRAYVEGSDDPLAELEDQETLLPACRVGDRVYAQGAMPPGDGLACSALDPKRHETLPPARYTEAALIKELEAAGIGRPSTYASIIATIQSRGYVFRQGKALVPSFTAFAVTELLRQHFADYVDVGFTAEMEEVLDAICNGEQSWLEFVRAFYRGDGKHVGLEKLIETKPTTSTTRRSKSAPIPRHGAADPRAHRPVRAVPAAWRGRRRQHGVAARRPAAGRPHRRARRRTAQGQGARARASSGPIRKPVQPVYVMSGRFGAVRAARRDAGQATRRPRSRSARRCSQRHEREHRHARRGAAAAVAAARARACIRTTASR